MEPNTGKKQVTHERIVDAAARAIRRSGFAGVGVADVMKEAGLTHGGFYAHFESREAMLAEAVARAGRDSAASLAGRIEARRARGVSTLRAVVEGYLSDSHLAGTEFGCPVAALVSEVPRQSPELREAAVQRVNSLIDVVRRALAESHTEESSKDSTKERAMVIVSTMVGALQLARALGANAKGKAMLAAARESLLAAHDAV